MEDTKYKRRYPDFGYTAAMEAALQTFSTGSRATGRTTRLIEMAEPGTVIFVHNQNAQRGLEAALRNKGKDSTVTVCVMRSDGTIPSGLSRPRAILLDSPVIEDMMRRSILEALAFADYLDRESAVNDKHHVSGDSHLKFTDET